MRPSSPCLPCWRYLLLVGVASAFVGVVPSAVHHKQQHQIKPSSPHQRHVAPIASSKEALSEAQRLLEKAKQLREQALKEEQKVHDDLAQKKAEKDDATDRLVDELFFDESSSSGSSLVDRLRDKRLGVGTLEALVDRLDEREVIANGLDHVEFQMVGNKAECKRVQEANRDQDELDRLEGLIDDLIRAVAVLDEEFLAQKKEKGELYVAHAEEEHWGGGKCAERLQNRVNEIRRERSDHFQKRLEEFREAQRLKDDDDHKFKGYTDLGTLN